MGFLLEKTMEEKENVEIKKKMGTCTGDDDDFAFFGLMLLSYGLVMNGSIFQNDGYVVRSDMPAETKIRRGFRRD